MKAELMSPAKNIDILKAALDAGADSVYFGYKEFNARYHSENFTEEEFIAAVQYAHSHNAKAYLTLNTLIKDNEVDKAVEYANKAVAAGIDAIIVQDIGLSRLLNELPIPLIASTQMTVCNLMGVAVAKEMGFKRVVLARELNTDELISIAHNTFGIELECFIHGGLCIGYSGQCSASSIFDHAASNRGMCQTPCWDDYTLYKDGKPVRSGKLIKPKDMFGLEHIKELSDAGINAFKIQGRTRDINYINTVVPVYRKYVDSIDSDEFKISEEDICALAKASPRGLMRGNLETTINSDFTVGGECDCVKPEAESSLIGYAKCGKPLKLTAVLNNLHNLDVDLINAVFVRIYLPFECFVPENFSAIEKLKKKASIYLIMPFIMERHKEIYNVIPKIVQKYGIDGISLTNIGDLTLIDKLNVDFVAERSLNTTNYISANYYKEKGINCISLPFELSDEECLSLSHKANVDVERTIYGRPILMQMKYCLLSNANECLPNCNKCSTSSRYILAGRNSYTAEFSNKFSRTILRPVRKLALPILDEDVKFLRLEFTDESVNLINFISKKYSEGFYPEGTFISEIGSV